MHTYPDKKWMVEAVSTGKVKKLRKYLDRVYLFKGNLMEAVEVAQSESSDIEKVVKALLEKGIKNVVVTQGANDVWYGNEKGIGKIPVIPAEKIVNTTGAGDAMFAGIVDQINSGHTLEEAIVFGMKLSSLTLQSVKAVAEEVDGLKYEH
jgi:sugar/nucleoside kinase (ribokinase family)